MRESYESLGDYLEHGSTNGLGRLFTDAAPERIAALYRNGYLRACREALAARYPVMVMAMGEAAFRMMSHAYIEEHPPLQRTLTGYGREFPYWFSKQSRGADLPWLTDLGKLDGAWLDCLYGSDELPLTAQRLHAKIQLAGALPESLRMLRNTQLVELDYPVNEAWMVARNTGLPPTQPAAPCAGSMLFWRPEMKVLSRNLKAWEVGFCRTLIATNDIEKASEQYPTTGEGPSPDLYFAELIGASVLTLGEKCNAVN